MPSLKPISKTISPSSKKYPTSPSPAAMKLNFSCSRDGIEVKAVSAFVISHSAGGWPVPPSQPADQPRLRCSSSSKVGRECFIVLTVGGAGCVAARGPRDFAGGAQNGPPHRDVFDDNKNYYDCRCSLKIQIQLRRIYLTNFPA